ncbi:golgin subfamily A member 5 [Vanessa cardui]|uniref:golgin subfamily A member 5 n=1 Tax=Vanessa cardui TaxID=171605 RepID=UPI001F14018F|nr:golgin subfamily A member 5 [Vanessa cardui]XP_046971826.1 golgin subfamily A member 5 [Vanessa cardui]
MSWFSDLAGKAESLLNNLDEQTGVVLRNHNGTKETWTPKKKTNSRNTKRNSNVTETRSNYTPSGSPTKFHQSRSVIKPSQDNGRTLQESSKRKSPARKPITQYSLNNAPKTLVGDFNENKVMDQFGLRHRRYSLPSDLEIMDNDNIAYNMQNCEIENAMLKNELNVMNREVSELLDRLSKTEDELKITQTKYENSEKLNHMLREEKEALVTQADKIKQQENEVNNIQSKYIEQNQCLESTIHSLEYKNSELEEKIKTLTEELSNKEVAQNKLENELRHAQTMITEKQNEIEKSSAECHRLEKDWESYKLRVKNMLFAKDNEIKSLRDGVNSTEDTKLLVEQIESLKEEREDLSQSIARVRQECDDMKQSMTQLEQRHSAAERVVSALRDTLKEERSSRNRAEVQCLNLGKELQSLQIESTETIASLRAALENKEEELNNLRESASAVPMTDTSALNVADYDVIKDMDNEKIHYLTQMLIQKQGKIDTLLADNNILKIQLDKLQSKHRSDLASLRSKYSHSVVHLQDQGDTRARSRLMYSGSPLSALSLRIGVMIKRFPIFRLLILIYMIGLHLWVVTVLFTNTPQDYVPRPTKL